MTAADPEPPLGGAVVFLAVALHDAFAAGRRVERRRVEEILDLLPLSAASRQLVRQALEGG